MDIAAQVWGDDSTLASFRAKTNVQFGVGLSPGHHGEILQGMFEDVDGELHRGLVTLPVTTPASMATFRRTDASGLRVSPPGKEKSEIAASLVAAHLGIDNLGGDLTINTRVHEALGLGSSTADVVATARAVARAIGVELRPYDIARIAVLAEEASDSVMHLDSTVLFAQREGRIIEVLGPLIPAMGVVSFTSGPPVKTSAFKPAGYDWLDVQQFKPLLGQLRYALSQRSVVQIAIVATKSAHINQRFLPKPHFDAAQTIVDKSDALGLQVAHSGNVMGILFDLHDGALNEKVAEVTARLKAVDIHRSAFLVAR